MDRLILFVFIALALGCAKPDPSPNVAREIADKFYQALKQKDFEQALNYYSPKRSTDEWHFHIQQSREKLGDVTSVTFKRQEVNTTLRGRFFIFDYQVEYSSGQSASEILTLFHKVDEEGTFIVSHSISAETFKSSL